MFSFNANKKQQKQRVYLDYASATPVDPRVLRKMEPYFSRDFGNPSTVYREGVAAREALERARVRIADAIGARLNEIIFTSGGTEANNLAIHGLVNALNEKGRLYTDMHIVTTNIEHSSAKNIFAALEQKGISISYVPVSEDGVVNPKDIQDAITRQTILVSCMYVNNEIGTIQPIREIAKVIRNFRKTSLTNFRPLPSTLHLPYFHTDASQAPLFRDCSIMQLGVDLMSIDAGKFYGPKGIGFLYVKKGVSIKSLFDGGGQEHGLRPGAENIPLIIGLAESLVLAAEGREAFNAQMSKLRNHFIRSLTKMVPQMCINGDLEQSIAGIVNISIPGTLGEFLVVALDAKGIACAARSACVTGEVGSYVVAALGGDEDRTVGSLRFSFGRDTTAKDLDGAISALAHVLSFDQ